MNERRLTFELILLVTVRCLAADLLSTDQLQMLKRRALVQTYGEVFHVSSVTFACNKTEDTNTKYMLRQLLERDEEISVKRVSLLEDEDMNSLLRFKGGTFMPEYLATDTNSARQNFPDAKMMRFKRSSLLSGRLAQVRQRLRDLQQWHSPTINSRKSKSEQGKILSTFNLMERLVPYQNGTGYRKLKIQQVASKRPFISMSAYSQIRQDIRVGRRKKRDDSDSLFPSDDVTPETVDTGIVRVDENCSEAGQPSAFDPNYLHLCKICSAKRVLSANHYPRVINEVFCKSSDDGCLGNGNGKCVPTLFNVHILRRREDICRLCVKNSEPLAVNEWEIYVEPIRVGCECMLDKNSAYRRQWFASSSSRSANSVG